MGLGDFCSSIFVVLVLSLFSASVTAPGALAGPREECASFLRPVFYSDPSTVEWRVDLRRLCPVTNQGSLSTCWASAGVNFLKPALVRAGLLKASENLSRDYYSALIMRDFAKVYQKGRTEIFMEELGPYFSTEVYHTILRAGIVLEKEYHFPRIPISSAGGSSRTGDVRTSPLIQEEFMDELNEVRGAKRGVRFQEVLNAYLGDPSRVIPRVVPESFIQAHEPEVFVTHPDAWKRIQEEGLDGESAKVLQREEVEPRVRASLDAGNPVMITISKLEHFEAMRSGEATLIREMISEGEYGGEHAVTIVGYGTGADGKSWYLLQNNGGKRWGFRGAIAASGAFMRSEVERFFLLR